MATRTPSLKKIPLVLHELPVHANRAVTMTEGGKERENVDPLSGLCHFNTLGTYSHSIIVSRSLPGVSVLFHQCVVTHLRLLSRSASTVCLSSLQRFFGIS